MAIDISSLKESSDFLNNIFDHISSAIFLVDKNFQIQAFNNSFQTLFHKNEDKIFGELCGNAIGCSFAVEEGKSCGETVNCDNCELRSTLFQTFLSQVPANKKTIKRYFYVEGVKKLKYFQFSTRFIEYKDREMVLIIVDDITELEAKKIELENQNLELNKLNSEKNKFLGMAAHDLRNPLSTIFSCSSILLKSLNGTIDAEQKNFLSIIKNKSSFSLDLIDDLLDISKIEASKLDLNLQHYEYDKFLKENIKVNRIFAENKNIYLSLCIEPNLPLLEFDKDKVEQVLDNLLSNAIKYSHPYSKVTVEAFVERDHIVTKVTDQGVGIPEEDLSKIFNPFEVSKVQPVNEGKSTGLGLAIVKRIVEGHKGVLGVESEVGKGSAFWFSLPLNNIFSI